MEAVTIPKELSKRGELVIIPRKDYEKVLELLKRKTSVSEADVLRWSRETKKLRKTGKLPILHSLRDLR